jgi:hypothetical protein
MKSSERLAEALQDLRGEHCGIQPPAHIRAHMQDAVKASRLSSASMHGLWPFAFAGCASLFLALLSVAMLQFQPQAQFDNSAEQALRARESTSVFVPLPSSAGLPPPEETCLLRVRLQRSDLRQFGLELPDAPSTQYTQVDFVVGEDGLARAVRFVQPISSGSVR